MNARMLPQQLFWLLIFLKLYKLYVVDTDHSFHRQEFSQYQCSGPEVINHFSCSTQLSMKFCVLINLKLLSIANSFLLNLAEHENFTANKYVNANYCWHFHIY